MKTWAPGCLAIGILFAISAPILAHADETAQQYIDRRTKEVCHSPEMQKIPTAQLVQLLKQVKNTRGCEVRDLTQYTSPADAGYYCVDGYCNGMTEMQIRENDGGPAGEMPNLTLTLRNTELCSVQDGDHLSIIYSIHAIGKKGGALDLRVGRYFFGDQIEDFRTVFEFDAGKLSYVGDRSHNGNANKPNFWPMKASETSFECGQRPNE
jgi:hypothetical protein